MPSDSAGQDGKGRGPAAATTGGGGAGPDGSQQQADQGQGEGGAELGRRRLSREEVLEAAPATPVLMAEVEGGGDSVALLDEVIAR